MISFTATDDRGARALRRRPLWCLMTVVLLVMGASVAGAPGASAGPAVVSDDGHIQLDWDSDVVELDWRGQAVTSAQASFVGDHVVVPGDQAWRNATVRNAGPGAAVATIEIIDVADSVPGLEGADLDSVLRIGWKVADQSGETVWSDLLASSGRTLGQYPIAQGGTLPLTIGYHFPVDATEGRQAHSLGEVLSFGVRISLQGDVGASIHSGGALIDKVPSPVWWGLAVLAIGCVLVVVRPGARDERMKTFGGKR